MQHETARTIIWMQFDPTGTRESELLEKNHRFFSLYLSDVRLNIRTSTADSTSPVLTRPVQPVLLRDTPLGRKRDASFSLDIFFRPTPESYFRYSTVSTAFHGVQFKSQDPA
jgi:hypothetical protein